MHVMGVMGLVLGAIVFGRAKVGVPIMSMLMVVGAGMAIMVMLVVEASVAMMIALMVVRAMMMMLDVVEARVTMVMMAPVMLKA